MTPYHILKRMDRVEFGVERPLAPFQRNYYNASLHDTLILAAAVYAQLWRMTQQARYPARSITMKVG